MSDFGAWFRSERLRRGLRAGPLSIQAGLSRTYISALERGVALPKADTIAAIADAMGLTGNDRDEFHRRALAAGKPDFVEQIVSGSMLPGAVIWKNLPGLLAACELGRPEGEPFESVSDDLKLDYSVPAIASLLAWRELHRRNLKREEVKLLRSIADNPGKVEVEDDRRQLVASKITLAWRAMCFETVKKAANAVDSLIGWMMDGGLYRIGSPRIGPVVIAAFKDHADRIDYDLDSIPALLARRATDALITRKLWTDLDLSRHCGGEPESWALYIEEAIAPVNDWLEFRAKTPLRYKPPATMPRLSKAQRAERPHAEAATQLARIHHFYYYHEECWFRDVAEFCLRLYEYPDLGKSLLTVPRDGIVATLEMVDEFERRWSEESPDPELVPALRKDEALELRQTRSARRRAGNPRATK